jgi:raffinose/stachyose/melibiose transport system permease protein
MGKPIVESTATAPGTRGGARGRRPSGRSPLDTRRRRLFFPFLLPALIVYVIFVIGPALGALWLSFNSWNGFGSARWVGLRNYTILVQDPAFQTAFTNTMIILVGVGSVVFVVSFALTMIMRDMRGRRFVRSVLFFPFIVSPIVLAIVWGLLFQHNGVVNIALKEIGINGPEWMSSGNLFKMILAGVTWISVGLYATIILAGVDRIPSYFYEDASLAGAGAFQRFRHITLPLSWDVVSVAAILWTINSLNIFEFIYAFGGGTTELPPPSVWNSALFVYGETFGGQVPSYLFGYASASALFMLAVFAVFIVLLRRLMRRDAIQY